MISRFKRLTKQTLGLHICRRGTRGLNVFDDLRELMPQIEVKVVFDVGANIGQSTLTYITEFPRASIYSFEPVASTFKVLQRVAAARRSDGRVQCFQLALSAEAGQGLMEAGDSSRMARLAARNQEIGLAAKADWITIGTLDAFSAEHRISTIDYLKIDTEGNDLQVVKGGEDLLRAQCVGVLEVEVGTHPSNKRHVPFQTMKSHLEGRGYLLFGIYDQVHEWIRGEPHLRRVNCVYIAQRLSLQSPALLRTP